MANKILYTLVRNNKSGGFHMYITILKQILKVAGKALVFEMARGAGRSLGRSLSASMKYLVRKGGR